MSVGFRLKLPAALAPNKSRPVLWRIDFSVAVKVLECIFFQLKIVFCVENLFSIATLINDLS